MHDGGAVAPDPVVEDARVVRVTATSFDFGPREISVAAGEDIAIELVSEDVTHGLRRRRPAGSRRGRRGRRDGDRRAADRRTRRVPRLLLGLRTSGSGHGGRACRDGLRGTSVADPGGRVVIGAHQRRLRPPPAGCGLQLGTGPIVGSRRHPSAPDVPPGSSLRSALGSAERLRVASRLGSDVHRDLDDVRLGAWSGVGGIRCSLAGRLATRRPGNDVVGLRRRLLGLSPPYRLGAEVARHLGDHRC